MKSLLAKLKSTLTDSETFLVKGKKVGYDKNNFEELKPRDSKLTFIDGGNAQIYASSGVSLQVIRLCAYADFPKLEEFFVLAIKEETKVKLYYEPTQSLPEELSPDYTPSQAIEFIRRLAELKYAAKFENPILDGALDFTEELEKEYISKIKSVCGLSKTNTFLTDKGMPLTYQLLRYNDKTWYYPLIKGEIEMGMVKLHTNSKHVFRVDVKNFDVAQLLSHCTDSIFLGYPYGLIEADAYARISNQELLTLKSQLLLTKEEMLAENSVNAHEILDKLQF